MKKSAIVFTLGALAAATASFAAKSPASEKVVMTVGPEKVTLSEFEYLYNKNNEQQAAKTSLDEYIDMFVNYKLKVAAAKDSGVDTTKSYVDEMKKYTDELARPYLRNAQVDDSLLNVAYDHMKEMVEVSHILIPGMKKGSTLARQRALADSVRNAITNGVEFAEAAMRYSMDRPTAEKGGYMGWVVGGLWPYTFEDLAFNTEPGQISKVAQSPYGFHIVRVLDRKPNPGQVKARHILKMTRGIDSLIAEKKHRQIDSLYNLLMQGADFTTIARRNTDEPQGRNNGGDLPWFYTGQMVKEFNDVAFALKPGEISKPVKTDFGWHIILCEDRRGVQPLDSVAAGIRERINNDERSLLAIGRTADIYGAKIGARIDNRGSEAVAAILSGRGLDENALADLGKCKAVAATLPGKTITVADVAHLMQPAPMMHGADAMAAYEEAAHKALQVATLEAYVADLPNHEPDYRNLLNEYRDGMLLYEVSNANVWERANNDAEGLQAYYEAHRGDYTWDRPHYKGYVIAATSDSIADEALKYLTAAGAANPDELTSQSVRKRYGNDVKVERVLAAKGDNAVVDNLCFNGPKPATGGRWKAYRTLLGRIIDQPEDARDVKGQVSLGYQQQLESQWLDSLRKKYKVKVDRKTLHKAFPGR